MSFFVDEAHALFNFISTRNRARQFDFLEMSYVVSRHTAGLEIDSEFISTLNAYATRYISMQPGRHRRHYNVTVGAHNPSDWSLVPEEMEAFLDVLHTNWARWTPPEAAAYALWGVNHVHPFCDGNGRTARALCYYVLCQKIGQWLPGRLTVLEQIRTSHREHHCNILQRMHEARARPDMTTDITELATLIDSLVVTQISTYHMEQAAAIAAASGMSSAAQP
ncbi:Fic family protein [Sphingomonas xinjiangensis]|uniref:Fic family protein n=1 Tax=Sphingomonas xinjiangensis TaxID=643568 RepID=A0A840YCH2_9SPHN|nr:Fic family protein [Sphingomonas xinjiangensis]MBB5711077.1 Fic family protein [Sphingomonas xinjiangensis]